MSGARKSKKRFQKSGKRYEHRDRRLPKRQEFNTKNRAKHRNGKGKGKFTWGDEMEDMSAYYDEHEYQEYEQEAEMEQAYDQFSSGVRDFMEELQQYKAEIRGVIRHFFQHGEASDLLLAVQTLDPDGRFNYDLVKRAITMSLDFRNREREMVSQLLAVLHGDQGFLSSDDIADGFLAIFEQIDDLKLDCPKAGRMVAKFLARAITDECLPPKHLVRGTFIKAGGAVVQEAKVLLSMKHGITRMERVWGSSAFTVTDLKKEIRDLVLEYIVSEELAEAVQCVRDLDSRNFHHEVVKRAVELSMDYSADKQKKVALLLHTLYVEEVVHPSQFVIGFKRLFENLPSLKMDVPAAESILTGFVAHGRKTGYLPATYMPPAWMEGQSSGDEDNESTRPSFPVGFTAEMAEQMAEFEDLSPRTDRAIVESLGVPEDVIEAARLAGVDADSSDEESSSGESSDPEEEEEESESQEDAAQKAATDAAVAQEGLSLLQAGLRM